MSSKEKFTNLKHKFEDYRQRVDMTLDFHLPTTKMTPELLHQAMRYSVFNGGKRIRPILVYLTGEAISAPLEILEAPAAAVECIHAYSLIHDDLPAMDDDDLRRGKPTCHKKFDEATAILAGDALQALAFKIIADKSYLPENSQAKCEIMEILADAASSVGMVGGQVLDLESENRQIELHDLENIHTHKTGALIGASVMMAVASAGISDTETRNRLEHYAASIGLAFQVKDDILDIESDTETLGKPVGSDEELHKATYPSLIGLDNSKKMALELMEEAISVLEPFDNKANPLRELATYIVERKS
ncbi:MAG: (2E,6E)-farnesyl diphosphate synthase [Gammaproteobacteria bacterium]|nr:MAG: (2E,6E)-farnesyl diphosphate synthase [Gammaproteobacteria bacterium]